MIFYGVGAKDLIRVQSVTTLPTWTSSDTRRLIYNEYDNTVYYGTATAWAKVATHSHLNQAVLDEITAVDGKLYYEGASVSGVLVIPEDYIFSSILARDDYFTANPTELVEGLNVIVQPNDLYEYTSEAWVNMTPVIRGPRGYTGFGAFTIRAVGPLAEKYLYDSEDEGFSYLAVDTQKLYIRWGAVSNWGGPYDFPNLNSSGMEDWERFPGYTVETKFDYPYPNITTEILKLTINDAVFATRTTTVTDTGFEIVIECPTLSIYRKNVMVATDTSITETITNIEV